MSATGDVVRMVNEIRDQEGLPPLSGDKKLATAALRRASSCARKGRISHDGWLDALRKVGLRIGSRAFGENLAQGQERAAEAVRAWMDSPGHRANILAEDYRRIGVGVAEGHGDRFWAQIFSS